MSIYHLAAAVLYTNTAVVGVRLWGIHMLCICGVEVFPMVNFRTIDIYVNIISRIVGTVQGDYDPLVQVDVRGARYPSGRALFGDYDP